MAVFDCAFKPLCSANRVGCYTMINLKRPVSFTRARIQILEATRNVMAELKMGRLWCGVPQLKQLNNSECSGSL